jgi:enoyl-CoA hydratase/carnithine racemase
VVEVLLERSAGIATVTLNRPERRNAMSDALLEELIAALETLRDDAATRAVLLTGAPPVFSAGADAGLRARMSEAERRRAFLSTRSRFSRLFPRALGLLEGLEQPTIAVVNGHAVGGGWVLALGCDFRFAAAEAQFWIPEVDLGIPLHAAFTTRFVRLIGPARAKEIIMDGCRHTAAGTLVLGLVHRVEPGAVLQAAAREYARALARKPAGALAVTKARIGVIASVGMPEVNAVTEGLLDRP